MNLLERPIDALMEATVIPSFSRIGIAVRRRLAGWEPVENDLDGKVVLITGATSGIGRAAAMRLATLGATIRTVGRNVQQGEEAVAAIRKASGNDDVTYSHLDMGDFAAVRGFAARFADEHARLDALVHNAGALLPERRETAAGVEVTLAVHLLGPYVLTRALQPLLAQTRDARVIFMASGGMYAVGLDLDELERREDGYDGRTAYALAKRAQVVLVEQLAPELAEQGIVIHAKHPGWAATPGLDAGIPLFGKVSKPILRSPEDGADTLVWLVADPAPARSTGLFWHDRRARSTVKLPGTRVDDATRRRLIPWIEARIAAAEA